ncbi:hypothetical protein BU019_10605 [Staphylococcus simulans]|uniref:hypothetical protein n=1 Tax=Staphylococcus simulans TaxID=1286 RepID=UPI000D1DD658|nr:hypothetical protein [Staphylococcus simulans]MEB6835626.1 hypothetical protein [Staphylococcus simulans]PTJ50487.1 hypothetical protein BU019_10605 [Staphylococcus simulans]
MSITELIYNEIIKDEWITIKDNVFRYVVPQNFHTQTSKPIVRIFPLPFNPEEYADNEEMTREYDIQVDIWWSENEPSEQAERIAKRLKELDFKSYYREPLYEVETMTFREIIRANGSLFI